jgi:chromosome segregation ATPase
MKDEGLKRRLDNLDRSLQRIERFLDAIFRAERLIYNQERQDSMTIKDTITQLQNDVRDNKDASDSVKTALEGYAKANSDLTQQLKDAIAKVADDTDVTALNNIATQLEANNAELHAAAPATAAAVVDNTPQA